MKTIKMVMVTNSAGVAVAPPQRYVPDHNGYYFNEVPDLPADYRIARLVSETIPGVPVCNNQLVTPFDKEFLSFGPGLSFQFNLFPRSNSQKNDN